MSRFLFVVLPLAGHANPAVAVSRALAEAGHQVAWVGPEGLLRPRLGPDTQIYPTGMRPYRGQLDRGMAALRSLWAQFVVPFARFTLPMVDQAVRDYQPDVLVVDQHAVAGALVACRYGMRWATLVPQMMELTEPLRGLPAVHAWVLGQVDALAAGAGLAPDPRVDLRFSPYLVVAFTSRALIGEVPLPDQVALVGPAMAERPGGMDFPWHALDPDRRHVLVTVGTLALDVARDFYPRVLTGLRPLADRAQAIVVAPAGAVPDPPDHVLVVPEVPMLRLMPHLDAVLCHGGLNTVCEALAYGVPLVVAPIRHDQPVNATQVARCGAGIRLSFARARPDQLGAAVAAVLDDPAYRQAAGRIRDSFTAAGGAPAAAARLAALAAAPEPVLSTMDHDRPVAGGGSPR